VEVVRMTPPDSCASSNCRPKVVVLEGPTLGERIAAVALGFRFVKEQTRTLFYVWKTACFPLFSHLGIMLPSAKELVFILFHALLAFRNLQTIKYAFPSSSSYRTKTALVFKGFGVFT
jgi:hypothetical protein